MSWAEQRGRTATRCQGGFCNFAKSTSKRKITRRWLDWEGRLGGTMLTRLITGNIHFDHLVRVVSAGFLRCKVNYFFSLQLMNIRGSHLFEFIKV